MALIILLEIKQSIGVGACVVVSDVGTPFTNTLAFLDKEIPYPEFGNPGAIL